MEWRPAWQMCTPLLVHVLQDVARRIIPLDVLGIIDDDCLEATAHVNGLQHLKRFLRRLQTVLVQDAPDATM